MSNDRVHHSQGNSRLGGRGSGRTSVMFEKDTNNGRDDKYCILVLESDNTTSKVMCYNWNKLGHMSHNFNDPDICRIDSNGVVGSNGRLKGLHLVQTCLRFTQDGKRNSFNTLGCCCIQIVQKALQTMKFY